MFKELETIIHLAVDIYAQYDLYNVAQRFLSAENVKPVLCKL